MRRPVWVVAAVLAGAVLLGGCQVAGPVAEPAAGPTPTATETAGPAETPTSTTDASASDSPSTSIPSTVSLAPTAAPAKVTVQASVHTPTRAEVASSWHEGCPVTYTELRVIEANYLGFDGAVHRGSVVVNRAIVTDTVALLQAMLDARFPLRSLRPVDDFGGSDGASMAADNSSAFNCRAVTGGTSWSKHAYGRAIDLNPVENPYIKGGVQPAAGADYLDRADVRPGMLVDSSPVVTFALTHGWTWLKSFDYQHFER